MDSDHENVEESSASSYESDEENPEPGDRNFFLTVEDEFLVLVKID